MAVDNGEGPFAVKIPGDLVERLSLKQGDRVSVNVTEDGKLLVRRTDTQKVVARVSPVGAEPPKRSTRGRRARGSKA